MMRILPLLIFIVVLIACRGNAQQMAHNNDPEKPVTNVYQDIDNVSAKIQADPMNAELRNSRAVLYLKINEFEKALQDIEAGISAQPNNDKLYYTQALVYLKRKNMDSALESINKALEIVRNENNLFLRANIYSTRGETREAIVDMNEIIALNPRCDYCYLQKALWCNDLNMFYEEIKNYLYYIEISKDGTNVEIVKNRLKKMKNADNYYKDLIRFAKKDIKKNGYPWEYQVWE